MFSRPLYMSDAFNASRHGMPGPHASVFRPFAARAWG